MSEDKTVTFEVQDDVIAALDPLPTAAEVSAKPVHKKSPLRWIIPVALVILLAFAGGYAAVKHLRHTGSKGGILGFDHDYIAVLDVEGEISSAVSSGSILESASGYDHSWTMNEIDQLIEDTHNKGLLLRVNSPGGSVYTSDEIYYKLLEYREKTGRPIYSYMGSMAASGGYYISAPCDRIYANRNCWTGSIGVTTGTMYNISGLLEKIGVEATTITSGPNKSMGSSTEEMTDEQRAIMQSLIDEAYDQFVGIVAEGRHMSEAEVKKVADGRILTAKQAKKAGLIDGIMNEEDAIEKMKKDEKLEKCEMEYLAPIAEESLFSYIRSGVRDGAKSEISEYREFLALARTGNLYTISYLAPISR